MATTRIGAEKFESCFSSPDVFVLNIPKTTTVVAIYIIILSRMGMNDALGAPCFIGRPKETASTRYAVTNMNTRSGKHSCRNCVPLMIPRIGGSPFSSASPKIVKKNSGAC